MCHNDDLAQFQARIMNLPKLKRARIMQGKRSNGKYAGQSQCGVKKILGETIEKFWILC